MKSNKSEILITEFDADCITSEYLLWLNDKRLMRYSRQATHVHTKESCLQYLESFKGTSNEFWSLKNETGEQIGTMTAYINLDSQTADIGILIGEGGQGLGSVAWGKAIQKLFQEEKIRKVTAGTLSVHKHMISIFEKHGMKKEGHLREQQQINGEIFDVVRYGLLKREWVPPNN